MFEQLYFWQIIKYLPSVGIPIGRYYFQLSLNYSALLHIVRILDHKISLREQVNLKTQNSQTRRRPITLALSATVVLLFYGLPDARYFYVEWRPVAA